MRSPVRIVVTTAFLVMAVGGPAAATHTLPGEPFVPQYVETAVYLHCNGDTKVGNFHATVEDTRVSFDTTKPTASYQSGAGCGTVDTFLSGAVNHNPIYDFPVRGTFTGNIKTITVRYWTIDAGLSRALNEMNFGLYLAIDGTDIVTRPGENPNVTVTPVNSSTGISRLVEFTVTDVGLGSEADHTTEHEIELTMESWYTDTDTANIWVYDAAEIDSGLVINDTTPAKVKVPRDT